VSSTNDNPCKTIAVYPFSRAFLPYLTVPSLFPNAVIRTLSAPNGFALTGKDAGYADNRPAVGFVVQPEAVLTGVQDDVLLVPNGEWADDMPAENLVHGDEWMPRLHQKCLRFMEAYADAGKEIWCAMKLTADEKTAVSARCAAAGSEFSYLYHEPDNLREYDEAERLYTPEAAVLFVGEITPDTNAFEIALGLHQEFMQNGFCSALLSAQEPYTIANVWRFPDSLFLAADEAQKVYDINSRLKDIEETAAPDVIIVCLPGALMKFDNQFTNGFGVKPYLISQAVSADYAVVCVQHEYYNAAFYDTIHDLLLQRFGIPVRFFHTSNIRMDIQASQERGNLRFNYFDYQTAQNAIAKVVHDPDTVKVPVCNVLNGNQSRLFRHVLAHLLGEEETP